MFLVSNLWKNIDSYFLLLWSSVRWASENSESTDHKKRFRSANVQPKACLLLWSYSTSVCVECALYTNLIHAKQSKRTTSFRNNENFFLPLQNKIHTQFLCRRIMQNIICVVSDTRSFQWAIVGASTVFNQIFTLFLLRQSDSRGPTLPSLVPVRGNALTWNTGTKQQQQHECLPTCSR